MIEVLYTMYIKDMTSALGLYMYDCQIPGN